MEEYIDKSCCFTGHRQVKKEDIEHIKEKVRDIVCDLISKGITYYKIGGALGFDTIAAEIILELKKQYFNISLILVLPCKTQTKFWKEKDIEKYNQILKLSDKIIYVSESYFNGCTFKRNRYMIDNSKYYLKKNQGGTAYTVNYAIKKMNIIYI